MGMKVVQQYLARVVMSAHKVAASGRLWCPGTLKAQPEVINAERLIFSMAS
jgi:hypothetical protein